MNLLHKLSGMLEHFNDVHLTDSSSMDEHVRQTISVCNQRLYTV